MMNKMMNILKQLFYLSELLKMSVGISPYNIMHDCALVYLGFVSAYCVLAKSPLLKLISAQVKKHIRQI